MARATTAGMRRRAPAEDEGRYVVLALSAAAAAAILLAIVLRCTASATSRRAPGLRVALAAVTILLAWLFMNTMFALHYAHFFYGDADGPAGPTPAASPSPAAPSRTTGTSSTSPSPSA